MPKFMITVASPVFDMQFKYKNQFYRQPFTPQFNFPAIHLHGSEDEYKDNLVIHTLFQPSENNSKVIPYESGHTFPRQLTNDGFAELKQFVKQQYEVKNGSDDQFDVDYDEFNFNLRYA